jgi:hypothetical protein
MTHAVQLQLSSNIYTNPLCAMHRCIGHSLVMVRIGDICNSGSVMASRWHGVSNVELKGTFSAFKCKALFFVMLVVKERSNL